MNRLYYKEPYLKEFMANVKEIIEKDNKFHIVLDRTAFFPGGGGQFSDRGYIEDIEVIDVYEYGENIYHVLEEKIYKLQNLKCEIDWKRRFDGMQQHLAQHVLSGCFFKELNQNTASFHMGKEISTIDIRGNVDEKKAELIEKMANYIIYQNLGVKFFIPKKEELKKIKLRRDIPATDKDISVLEIEDLDINACCGVHPRKTLELQFIKIISCKKNKDCTRIEFLAGKRAVDNILMSDKIKKNICNELTCGIEDALCTIKNIKEKNNLLVEENRKGKSILNKYIKNELLNNIKKINDVALLDIIYNGKTIIIGKERIDYNGELKDIISLLNELIIQDKLIIFLGSKQREKGNLIFMKSKDIDYIDINLIFKKSIELIDGKGGGNKYLIQGSGKSDKIEKSIEVAKEYLNLIINNI